MCPCPSWLFQSLFLTIPFLGGNRTGQLVITLGNPHSLLPLSTAKVPRTMQESRCQRHEKWEPPASLSLPCRCGSQP